MSRGFEFISDKQFREDFDKHLEKDVEINCITPKRGTSQSAGYDFFAPFDIKLQPGEEIKVPTGIKAYMKPNEVLLFLPRSGHGFKYYLRLANTCGVVDSDYFNNESNEGHIWVKIRNEGDKFLKIERGKGMAQAIFVNYLIADNDSFEGVKRKGGLGSTDKEEVN